jgi:hypothetical protein
VVAAAAEQVSRNIQTVAAGAEIAHNANEAAKVAAQAVEVAGSTTTTVAKLGESPRDRGRREGDHEHRRADQPARAQRDHRGGPGR